MFGDNVRKMQGKKAAPKQEPIAEPAKTLPSAEEMMVAELASLAAPSRQYVPPVPELGLTLAGSGYVPPAEPVTEPAALPVTAVPAEPVTPYEPTDAEVQSVVNFLRMSPDCSRKEISGGTGLHIGTVQCIAESLVSQGILMGGGRYRLASSVPSQRDIQPPVPPLR